MESWGRLDRHSAWVHFASMALRMHGDAIREYAADVVLGVDWTALPVYHNLFNNGALCMLPSLAFCFCFCLVFLPLLCACARARDKVPFFCFCLQSLDKEPTLLSRCL